MSKELFKVSNILSVEKYANKREDYNHLFEIQFPPDDINIWKIRYNFDLGTPLVGDLLLDVQKEHLLEIHPFPEWVVHLYYPGNVKAKPYLVIPNLEKSFIRKIGRKSIDEKIELIQDEINKLKKEDLIAVEYELGINILIPAFIPHLFLSSEINKEAGEKPPYLQVFEPNFDFVSKNLKIKPTTFFKLLYDLMI